MTTRSFATHRNEATAPCGRLPHWVVCILAVLVLGLGRPGFDMPINLVSEREIDPVEQEDAESEEELAIHCRGVFRRRVVEHAWSVTPRLVSRIARTDSYGRAVDPFHRLSPHDFDLRNGLGAALRC